MPKLFLGSDHRGFAEKQRLLKQFNESNVGQHYEIIDLGSYTLKPEDDYNDAAIAVSRSTRESQDNRGILLCGSAHGIAMQANRFRGVRAICGYTAELARLGRLHNNANILCLSADFMDPETINQVISTFLSTDFLPRERYIRRNRRLDEEEIYS